MKRALLIAEKPSLRRTIEDVYNKHQSEIPYNITFMEQRGHLLTLKYPNEIDEAQKEWSWENLPFHPEEHGGWQYKIISEKKVGSFLTAEERFKNIREELSSGSYDFVINAGDPDQEGELLVRIVLSAIRNTLPIKRYWSNDTTEEKVLEALQNLRDDDNDPMLKNLLAAAYGRQHSDYRFGMNITRAATLRMGTMVACGRVKTPILAIVCRRENEIKNFKPSTTYGVVANYAEGFNGQYFDETIVEADDSDEKSDDKDDKQNSGIVWFEKKEDAEAVINGLSSPARVLNFETKRVISYAPKLFKLSTAQIAAGKLGLNSSQTLETIQSLYEKGYVSYPRTDCEYLSSGEDFRAMLESASSVPFLTAIVSSIDSSVIGKVKATKKWVNDKKLTESGHSAIVPTKNKPNFDELSGEEKAIYAMICRQFVAIFMPPLVQDKTILVTDISGKTFKSNGKTLIDAGYTKLFGTKFTDAVIPLHTNGDVIDVSDFELSTKTTTCPKHFTDADLIAACEAPHRYLEDERLKALGKRLSIGTPATRASIIKELIDGNKYLQVTTEKKAKYIVPTQVGMAIYENLKDLDICKVDLTGQWEEKLEMVRKGTMMLSDLEADMKVHVEELINNIKSNTDMTQIKKAEKVVVCQCPECGGDIISGGKGFYCSNYKEKSCAVGSFKKVCDTTIKNDDFAKMLAGQTVNVMLQKGTNKWPQDLRYNFAEHKIEFVQAQAHDTEYKCPKCGGILTDDGKKIKCKDSCGFSFWKVTCGKVLSEKQIESFFTTGKTGVVKGLKGKSGKSFDANIVLNDDRSGTKFEFESKNPVRSKI